MVVYGSLSNEETFSKCFCVLLFNVFFVMIIVVLQELRNMYIIDNILYACMKVVKQKKRRVSHVFATRTILAGDERVLYDSTACVFPTHNY